MFFNYLVLILIQLFWFKTKQTNQAILNIKRTEKVCEAIIPNLNKSSLDQKIYCPPLNVTSINHDETSLLIQFEKFIEFFNKVYNGTDEKSVRFNIWKMNTYYIKKHNEQAAEGKFKFWLKMNRFGDLVS